VVATTNPKQHNHCATVNDMLSYSKSENDRMHKLIPVCADDPPSNAESDSGTSSQDLRSAYAKYSSQRQKAAEALQAACPVL
jgi:hypothetical protein